MNKRGEEEQCNRLQTDPVLTLLGSPPIHICVNGLLSSSLSLCVSSFQGLPLSRPAMDTWTSCIALFVAVDFAYYWLHRCAHTNAILWLGHSVHHDNEHYNLSTAVSHCTPTPNGPALAPSHIQV